jgi:hypothetical protein
MAIELVGQLVRPRKAGAGLAGEAHVLEQIGALDRGQITQRQIGEQETQVLPLVGSARIVEDGKDLRGGIRTQPLDAKQGIEVIRTDPRTGCEFSLSPDYYAPMCRRCHLRMDKAKITQCPHGHEYTPENTWYEKGSRVCRRCKLDRNEVRRRDKLRAAGKAVQPPA